MCIVLVFQAVSPRRTTIEPKFLGSTYWHMPFGQGKARDFGSGFTPPSGMCQHVEPKNFGSMVKIHSERYIEQNVKFKTYH